jgi:uncharacterized phage-associated protein
MSSSPSAPASKYTEMLKTPAKGSTTGTPAEEPTQVELQKSISRIKDLANAIAARHKDTKDKVQIYALNLEKPDDQRKLNDAREYLKMISDELVTSGLGLFMSDSPAELADNTANSTDKGLHSTLFRAVTGCIKEDDKIVAFSMAPAGREDNMTIGLFLKIVSDQLKTYESKAATVITNIFSEIYIKGLAIVTLMQALLSITKAISVAKVLLPQQPLTNTVIETALVNYVKYLNLHEIMLYNSIAKDIENKKAMAAAGDKSNYNNLNDGNASAHISNVIRELNQSRAILPASASADSSPLKRKMEERTISALEAQIEALKAEFAEIKSKSPAAPPPKKPRFTIEQSKKYLIEKINRKFEIEAMPKEKQDEQELQSVLKAIKRLSNIQLTKAERPTRPAPKVEVSEENP